MLTATIRHVEWSLSMLRPIVPHEVVLGGGGEPPPEPPLPVVPAAAVVVGVVVVVGGGVVTVVVVGDGAVVVVGGGCPLVAGGGFPPKPWFGGGTVFVFVGGTTCGGVPRPGTGFVPFWGGAVGPPVKAKLWTLPLAACANCGICVRPEPAPTTLWPPLERASWPIGAGRNPPRSSRRS